MYFLVQREFACSILFLFLSFSCGYNAEKVAFFSTVAFFSYICSCKYFTVTIFFFLFRTKAAKELQIVSRACTWNVWRERHTNLCYSWTLPNWCFFDLGFFPFKKAIKSKSHRWVTHFYSSSFPTFILVGWWNFRALVKRSLEKLSRLFFLKCFRPKK